MNQTTLPRVSVEPAVEATRFVSEQDRLRLLAARALLSEATRRVCKLTTDTSVEGIEERVFQDTVLEALLNYMKSRNSSTSRGTYLGLNDWMGQVEENLRTALALAVQADAAKRAAEDKPAEEKGLPVAEPEPNLHQF